MMTERGGKKLIMTPDTGRKSHLLLSVMGWAGPVVASVMLVALVLLDGVLHPPDWVWTLVIGGCAIMIPLGFGISLSCFFLGSRVENPRFRRHSIVGLVAGMILVLSFVILFFVFAEQPVPFLWAI